MNTTPATPAILKTLIGPAQRAALWSALEGEERDHFADIVSRLVATWQAMPTTYTTESQGLAALAHLHYFLGNADWWIVEKDSDPDNAGQIQAFGIADLGDNSIPEILAARASRSPNSKQHQAFPLTPRLLRRGSITSPSAARSSRRPLDLRLRT